MRLALAFSLAFSVAASAFVVSNPAEARQTVSFREDFAPGTVVIKHSQRRLYYVVGGGKAIAYPVGVGRAGKSWFGTRYIDGKRIKPAWAPPGSVFGPVWTVLYILMAVAAVLVVRRAGRRTTGGAMPLFYLQLGLNALWPWLFFRWRLGALSLAEIVALLVVLLFTVLAFARIHRLAAVLLLQGGVPLRPLLWTSLGLPAALFLLFATIMKVPLPLGVLERLSLGR